jgi:hypothetical protein
MRDQISHRGAIEVSGEPDFRRASEEDMADFVAAAEEVIEIYRVLGKTGDNVVGELLRGIETFYEWDHYPAGDVFDAESNSQYYYHAHPPAQRFPEEHGHFHTFLRPQGMPRGIKPAPVADGNLPQDPDDALSHLVAISMDSRGLPIRLFTTNRWVTGEVWYRAEDVCRMLPRFAIDQVQPSWAVNRWISAVVTLFRPQIEELLRARDAAVTAWERKFVPPNVYEDRELEVTSYAEVMIDDQVNAVRGLKRRRR